MDPRKRSAADKKLHAVKKHPTSKAKVPPTGAGAALQTIWIDEAGLAPEAAHRIDRKPDPNNSRYDTLYSGHIAKYNRRFGTHCLGLAQYQSILWTDNRSKTHLARGKNSDSRYFDKALHLEPVSSVLLPSKQPSSDPSPVLEDATGCIPIDVATQTADTKPAVTTLSPEEYISQQTATYNRSLVENPHDVNLWLQFIRFQDEALVWGKLPVFAQEGSRAEMKKRNQHALLERKIAIFERALENNPTSVPLLIGHMELCVEVWEEDKLLKRWKDLVFKHPNSPELWLAYIQFCQSHFSSFTVTAMSALYSKCISMLHAIQEGTLKSHRPHPHTPHSLLSIFYLYCSFMQQVGHKLSQEGTSHKDRLEFFETFWDSGVPRFGEAGAPGWNNWMQSTRGAGKPLCTLGLVESATYAKATSPAAKEEEEGVDPELDLIKGLPLEKAWLKIEDYREREQALPWRPSHGSADEDCTDPEHMVLFDDISPFLFRLSDPILRMHLVASFLHFLGAPVPCLAMTDHAHGHASMCLQWPWEVYHDPWRVTVDTLTYCHPSCSIAVRGHLNARPNYSRPAVGGFELLLVSEVVGSDLAGGSGLSKEAKQKVKVIQRLIKRILKLDAHRNNFHLWNCCAALEHALGNIEEAVKLYISVLSQMAPDLTNSGMVTLLVGCVERLLGLHTRPESLHAPSKAAVSKALHVLVSAVEGRVQLDPLGQPVSPSRLLRARNAYSQALSRGLETSGLDATRLACVCDVAMCYAMLECIGQSIKAAGAVFDTITTTLTTKLNEVDGEGLHCVFRVTLERGLEVCPTDAQLLRYFVESEQQSFISGRLRRFFDQQAPKRKTPLLWLYAIDAELWRYQKLLKLARPMEEGGDCIDEPETGVVHRIRGLFVRAAQDPAGRHCPLLWRLYMKFEMEHNNTAQAKAAFYQGIHHCPWSKALCYDATFYFPTEASKLLK
eukprot:Em0019g298a